MNATVSSAPDDLDALRVLYFSGTGNARNVAHWVAATWRERLGEASITDISRVDPTPCRPFA